MNITTCISHVDTIMLHVHMDMLHVDMKKSHVTIIFFHVDIIHLACNGQKYILKEKDCLSYFKFKKNPNQTLLSGR